MRKFYKEIIEGCSFLYFSLEFYGILLLLLLFHYFYYLSINFALLLLPCYYL